MKTERDPKYAQRRQFLFQQTLACREEKTKQELLCRQLQKIKRI